MLISVIGIVEDLEYTLKQKRNRHDLFLEDSKEIDTSMLLWIMTGCVTDSAVTWNELMAPKIFLIKSAKEWHNYDNIFFY